MAATTACPGSSLNVPVAVKDCVWPTEMVFAVGVTLTVCNVTFEAIAPLAPTAAQTTMTNFAHDVKVAGLDLRT
jgi:hypothetical protein